jgi:hypothetical protein
MTATSPAAWVPQFRRIGAEAWAGHILGEDNRRRRLRFYASAPDRLLGEILRHAALNDAALTDELAALYRQEVQDGLPLALRHAVYRHVAAFQQGGMMFSADAYLPFIICDPSRGLCVRAVTDYVDLAAAGPEDPLARVRDIAGIVSRRLAANPGAAFGALLHLGDRRVTALLRPLRDRLTASEAHEAAMSHTGFLSAAAVEFLLDWLEALEGDAEDMLFGIVANGLAVARLGMVVTSVATGGRPFPLAAATPEALRAMQAPVAVEAYAARIAPRLRRLAATEPEPQVMPAVLSAWGIDLEPWQRPWRSGGTAPVGGARQARRLARSNAEWLAEGGRILASWAVFDPDGPVLHCVGRSCESAAARLWYRWMHPLGGDGWDLGRASATPGFAAALLAAEGTGAASPYALRPVPGVPSFLGAAPGAAEGLRQLLLGAPAIHAADWGREMRLLRRYGADLLARAGAERRAALEAARADAAPDRGGRRAAWIAQEERRGGTLPGFAEAPAPFEDPRAFDVALFETWWETVTTPRFAAASGAAFAAAWGGAASRLAGVTALPEREPMDLAALGEFLAAGRHPILPIGR